MKKTSFKKPKRNFILLFISIFVLAIAVLLSNYLLVKFYFPKTTPFPDEALSYQIGNFKVSVPKTDIYTEYTDEEEESLNYYGRVLKTDMKDDSGCTRVNNLYQLYLEKSFPIPDNINYYSRLILGYEAWNTRELIFDNSETENTLLKSIKDLESLSSFENPTVLRKAILNADLDETAPSINVFGDFISCGGIYSIPFKVKTLKLSNYDLAYYLEVSEGNGSIFSVPSKVLVLKKSQDWLIVNEQITEPTEFKNWEGCPTGELSHEELACAYDMWNKKYSNVKAADIWINKMLDQIIYRPITSDKNSISTPEVAMDAPEEYTVKGVIKREKIPEDLDIGDYWNILYFEKPFLLEDNSSGKPMFINKIEVGYLQQLDEYLNKQVEITGALGWGYAESRTLSIKLIKIL